MHCFPDVVPGDAVEQWPRRELADAYRAVRDRLPEDRQRVVVMTEKQVISHPKGRRESRHVHASTSARIAPGPCPWSRASQPLTLAVATATLSAAKASSTRARPWACLQRPSRLGPGPGTGPSPDARAARPAGGPCAGPVPIPAAGVAAPCTARVPRCSPSTSASQSRHFPDPAAFPAPPPAVPAAAAAPAPRPAPTAAPRSRCPSPGSRPAAGPAAHAAPAPGRQIRHIRHKPRSCSTSPASSTARHDVSPQPHARDHRANGHKDSPGRGCRIPGGRSWAG